MFYLENWIHQIVGKVLGIDRVVRADIDTYQLIRLRQTIQYAFERSSFYRELFSKNGITADSIKNIRDLNSLPFTDPSDLAENPYRFLCISQAQVARPVSFVTSGTTGPRKKVFWSQQDLERIIEFMAAGIATVAGPDDVVQIMLDDGRPYSQADLLSRGVRMIGAKSVLAHPDISAEEQLNIMESSHSTVLFGYTGPLFRISLELQQKRDLRALGVRSLFAAGEYMPGGMRKQLAKIWNCPVHTHYGLTEMGLGVAVECETRNGYHFNEAGLLLEVIDPATGKAVPRGVEGELVFTTLTREAMPLIRYRTHDLSRLIPDPCPCGSETLLRIDSIRKRRESTVTLEGGGKVYPSLFDDALFEIPGLIDYRVTLNRHQEKDHLEFSVELLSPDPKAIPGIIRKLLCVSAIADSMAAGRMTDPTVRLVARGFLQTDDRRKKLIVLETGSAGVPPANGDCHDDSQIGSFNL